MIRRALLLSSLLMSLAAACNRSTSSAGTGPGAAASRTSPPAPPSPAQALDSVAGARRTVQAWNDALNHHDVAAMEGLYDERVRFYGREVSKAAVLKAKRGALAGSSTFTQKIDGTVAIGAGNAGEIVATFLKRSGSAGKLREVHAKLTLRAVEAGLPVITEETDEASAQQHEDAGPGDCESAAARVVSTLPAVKREVASAMREVDKSGGHATFGGFGPVYEADSKFTAGLGIYDDQSFQGDVYYMVDHGRLTVQIMGTELKVPPDALREVERACPQ